MLCLFCYFGPNSEIAQHNPTKLDPPRPLTEHLLAYSRLVVILSNTRRHTDREDSFLNFLIKNKLVKICDLKEAQGSK